MKEVKSNTKRIVLIQWKEHNQTEVFSNLKNFCLSYPKYNYNTLSNYLSKEKRAYDNAVIRVERKEIITKPKSVPASAFNRKIVPVTRKVEMKKASDEIRDLEYWLDQPVVKRAQAVTFLISQMLNKGERMDKTIVNKTKRQ